MITIDLKDANLAHAKMTTANIIARNIALLLKDLPYSGKIRPLTGWGEVPVVLMLDGDMPMEYSCGIVAEIEAILELEDSTIETFADVKRLEYRNRYHDHPFYVFSFPRNSCQWVKTGEITEATEETKLVCD